MRLLDIKIKAASLAAEARIIRKLESRLKRRETKGGKERPGLRDSRSKDAYDRIHDHRIKEIRIESRATHLARAFMKGHAYGVLEKSTRTTPPFQKAKEIAARFSDMGNNTFAVEWAKWQSEAIVNLIEPKHPAQQAVQG